MSAATANFSGTEGDEVVITFTPQADGISFLSGASVTVESTGVFTALDVGDNTASFNLPKDDSFILLTIMPSPAPESGTLTITVAGAEVFSRNKSVASLPSTLFAFGN